MTKINRLVVGTLAALATTSLLATINLLAEPRATHYSPGSIEGSALGCAAPCRIQSRPQ
jgi:hypothetical protein